MQEVRCKNLYDDLYVILNRWTSTQNSKIPIWNEILYIQTLMPNHSKNLTIELIYGEDSIIGTGLFYLNIFKNLKDR